jgi:hypothetical protein
MACTPPGPVEVRPHRLDLRADIGVVKMLLNDERQARIDTYEGPSLPPPTKRAVSTLMAALNPMGSSSSSRSDTSRRGLIFPLVSAPPRAAGLARNQLPDAKEGGTSILSSREPALPAVEEAEAESARRATKPVAKRGYKNIGCTFQINKHLC